jgi:phosphatidylinositol alpha-1,6-mannosyltransferase
VVDEVSGLLLDPERARTMGEQGRMWVQQEWRWDVLAGRLRELLASPA